MADLVNKEVAPVPLYYQVKTDIKKKIKAGEYPVGSVIPGELQLMKAYGVSRTTMVKALSDLVNDGLLRRIHGKGTFVSEPEPSFQASQMVGIAMLSYEHLYGPLSDKIIQNLEAHEYYCVLIKISEEDNKLFKLRSLVRKNPAYMIIDGYDLFPFELLDGYSGKIIFAFRGEGPTSDNVSCVLSDYYKGGRIVAEHFTSQGYKRIIHISHNIREKQSTLQQLVSGAVDVLCEKGIPPGNYVNVPYRYDRKKIVESVRAEKTPMAVFCNEDYIARTVYSVARELNLNIPEDISVIGYYNTPWCDIFHPKLTSVSVREDEMADIVAGMIINRESVDEKVLLEPRLIIRDSVRKASV